MADALEQLCGGAIVVALPPSVSVTELPSDEEVESEI